MCCQLVICAFSCQNAAVAPLNGSRREDTVVTRPYANDLNQSATLIVLLSEIERVGCSLSLNRRPARMAKSMGTRLAVTRTLTRNGVSRVVHVIRVASQL